MMQEFIDRTGFEPTNYEYKAIEEQYYGFDGDKDAFCKAWMKNEMAAAVKARAARIEELKKELASEKEAARRREDELQKELGKVKSELDMELDWKPCENMGTNMKQEDYLHLANGARQFTDEEAKAFINEEFGFEIGRIKIIREVSTYEVNKHHQCRKAETYHREPCYEATDWNYVRFNVRET